MRPRRCRSAARSNGSSGLETLIPPGAGEPSTGPLACWITCAQLVRDRLLALAARGVPADRSGRRRRFRPCMRWRPRRVPTRWPAVSRWTRTSPKSAPRRPSISPRTSGGSGSPPPLPTTSRTGDRAPDSTSSSVAAAASRATRCWMLALPASRWSSSIARASGWPGSASLETGPPAGSLRGARCGAPLSGSGSSRVCIADLRIAGAHDRRPGCSVPRRDRAIKARSCNGSRRAPLPDRAITAARLGAPAPLSRCACRRDAAAHGGPIQVHCAVARAVRRRGARPRPVAKREPQLGSVGRSGP